MKKGRSVIALGRAGDGILVTFERMNDSTAPVA